MGISSTGLAAIVKTKGNSHVHLILRGASWGPNFSSEHVAKSRAALEKARPDIKPSVMIDCSHGMLLVQFSDLSLIGEYRIQATVRRTIRTNQKY